MRLNNITKLFKEFTKSFLQYEEWTVEESDTYILASHQTDGRQILIHTVGRVLLKNETPMIPASHPQVTSLKEYAEQNFENVIPCISYGVGINSLNEFEITIVPLSVIEEQQAKGGFYNIGKNGYYYNYTKVPLTNSPIGSILQKKYKLIK